MSTRLHGIGNGCGGRMGRRGFGLLALMAVVCAVLLLRGAAPAWAQAHDFTPNPGVVIEDGEYPLPDLEGWTFLGEGHKDFAADVPGEELIKGYQKGDVQLIVAYINGIVCSYWYYDTKADTIYGTRADYDADGNFEQNAGEGGGAKFNYEKYGLQPE